MATTAVVKPEARHGSLGALNMLLNQYKAQIAIALPKHMTAERMIRVALSAVSGNRLLAECEPLSICASIVQASILGLEPNSLLGEAYLIPFWNSKLEIPGRQKKGGYQCQLMPGYQGLVKLCRNSGQVSVIDAQPVHENDEFDFEKGSDTWWRHKWPKTGDRGRIIGYWAGYVLKDGSKNFEYMTVEAIEAHRDKYSQSAYKKEWNETTRRKEIVMENGKPVLDGPWRDSPDWMYRKTPLKQVMKLMPKSIELRTALALDEHHEAAIPQQFSVEVPLELQPPVQDDTDPEDAGMPTRKSEQDGEK
jgi:recombination protein RecT